MMTDDDVNKVAAQVQAALRAAGVVVPAPGGDAAPESGDKARPQVRMPGDNRLVSSFAKEIGEHLAKDGVYLRDGVPVVIDPVRGRIVDLEADCFRSYVEKSVVVVRMQRRRSHRGPATVPPSAPFATVAGVTPDTPRSRDREVPCFSAFRKRREVSSFSLYTRSRDCRDPFGISVPFVHRFQRWLLISRRDTYSASIGLPGRRRKRSVAGW
jgi:hypothetical protein